MIFRTSFSLFSNNLWTEEERSSMEKLKQVSNSTKISSTDIPSKETVDSGPQQSSASVEEETTTDWTPEIPFENVMSTNFLITL